MLFLKTIWVVNPLITCIIIVWMMTSFQKSIGNIVVGHTIKKRMLHELEVRRTAASVEWYQWVTWDIKKKFKKMFNDKTHENDVSYLWASGISTILAIIVYLIAKFILKIQDAAMVHIHLNILTIALIVCCLVCSNVPTNKVIIVESAEEQMNGILRNSFTNFIMNIITIYIILTVK